MLNKDMDKCTGCGACIQICPKQCITWSEKEFGFKYPFIDEKKCISCGLCEQVCQIDKNIVQPEKQKAYAAVHKNKEILIESTSGGAFSAIAHYVLKKQGCVFGSTMDANMQVRHIYITREEELNRLRGSKYVQSDIGTTYSQAENKLKKGILVLFTGTPCQIAGLKDYLRKDYENLITADLVCHGVGAQAYFNKYLEYAEKKYGAIQELRFRSKRFQGWSCGNGEILCLKKNKAIKRPYHEYDSYYYHYFLKGEIYRNSCYTCPYASLFRPGDFTLGDFWGIEAQEPSVNARQGCSLMLVNTNKAERILTQLENLQIRSVEFRKAIKGNSQLSKPVDLSESRCKLAREYEERSAEVIQKAYFHRRFKEILKSFIKEKIPYELRTYIRKRRK